MSTTNAANKQFYNTVAPNADGVSPLLVIEMNKKTADNAQSSLEPQSRKQKGKAKKFPRSAEASAIFAYATSDYKFINGDLRSGRLSYKSKKIVQKMISGLQSLEPFDGCVWRGMSSKNNLGCKLEVAQKISDKAFLSTSTKKSVATDTVFLASGDVVFEICHHSGKEITHLSNENEKECEVFFCQVPNLLLMALKRV
jgi:hypothetical protein